MGTKLVRLPYTAGFDEFWRVYPRHEKKVDARKAWDQKRPTEAVLNQMLSALAWQRVLPQWLKDQGQYVPLPASYIRGERWEDEPPRAGQISARNARNLQVMFGGHHD